jgi:hypothetical protein
MTDASCFGYDPGSGVLKAPSAVSPVGTNRHNTGTGGKMRLHHALAVAGSVTAIAASAAAADGGAVTVFNNGNNPGSCSTAGFGGSYSGFATVIFNADGSVRLMSCHTTLTSGTPVSTTQVIRQNGCTVTFTPSGVADSSCPRFSS